MVRRPVSRLVEGAIAPRSAVCQQRAQWHSGAAVTTHQLTGGGGEGRQSQPAYRGIITEPRPPGYTGGGGLVHPAGHATSRQQGWRFWFWFWELHTPSGPGGCPDGPDRLFPRRAALIGRAVAYTVPVRCHLSRRSYG